jgi:hypothetical protein
MATTEKVRRGRVRRQSAVRPSGRCRTIALMTPALSRTEDGAEKVLVRIGEKVRTLADLVIRHPVLRDRIRNLVSPLTSALENGKPLLYSRQLLADIAQHDAREDAQKARLLANPFDLPSMEQWVRDASRDYEALGEGIASVKAEIARLRLLGGGQ